MKITKTFLIATLALGLITPVAQAQSALGVLKIADAEPVSGILSADDTDIVFIIRYIGPAAGGTSNSGTVAVAANGDLTFLQGAQGAEAASTEFECPVSGALGGIIDVSDAACNTVGEVLDVINASTSWRAVAIDAFRSDVVDNRILTAAATRATNVDGYKIFWDTSTAFDVTQCLVPPAYRTMLPYLGGNVNGRILTPRPYFNTQTAFSIGNFTSTYGSGSSAIRWYSSDQRLSTPGSANSYKGNETVTELYAQAGGATTVNAVFDYTEAPFGIISRRNERLCVRIDNTAAASAIAFRAFGFKMRYQNVQ